MSEERRPIHALFEALRQCTVYKVALTEYPFIADDVFSFDQEAGEIVATFTDSMLVHMIEALDRFGPNETVMFCSANSDVLRHVIERGSVYRYALHSERPLKYPPPHSRPYGRAF